MSRTLARPRAAALVAAFALALTGCGDDNGGTDDNAPQSAQQSTDATGRTTAVVGDAPDSSGAEKEQFAPGDWPVFGRDRDNTRFAPQTSITKDTISRLGTAWDDDLGGNQFLMESFPLVVDGTLYVTTSTNEVFAFDAATGQTKWKYAPDVDFSLSTGVGGYGVSVNRGVAVANGQAYLLTFDGKLKSISTQTGEETWSSEVVDPRTGAYETMSPTVWDGKVYVGSSGSEQGIRGFVAAYDAKTGKEVWRFYTVPKAGTGWVKPGNGGGTVYMAPTIDTDTGILYAGTGNPSPTIVGEERPGNNLYTSSIIALNAQNGKLLWYNQQVPHDLWDYDAASPPFIFETTKDGKKVKGVAEAGKSGWFAMMDAKTGENLFPRVPFVTQDHKPPTREGTLECPGPMGGSQYSPVAYSPKVNAAYISGIEFCFILKVDDKPQHGESKFGGTRQFPADVDPSGTFTAVDLNTGKKRWTRKTSTPLAAGATVTASNLVFAGDQLGNLYAFDAETGETVWKENFGLAFAAAPIVYTVDGTDYIAFTVGGGGVTSSKQLGPIGAHLFVLKLDGKKIVPAKPAGEASQLGG